MGHHFDFQPDSRGQKTEWLAETKLKPGCSSPDTAVRGNNLDQIAVFVGERDFVQQRRPLGEFEVEPDVCRCELVRVPRRRFVQLTALKFERRLSALELGRVEGVLKIRIGEPRQPRIDLRAAEGS